MKKMHFGWIAPVIGVAKTNYVPVVMLQEAEVLAVVAKHFDSLWVFDHLYATASKPNLAAKGTGDTGLTPQPSDPWLEAWTTLTWLAARYPTVQIGPLVLGVGYRNPALLAKMAATLQVLSGGRLVLGLGVGWREEEFGAYGYSFPNAQMRIQQVEEAVQIMRHMWTETAPSFQGEYFTIHEAYCSPLPMPPPPILIGGEGERLMLPLMARHADWWNVYVNTMEEVTPYLATYQRKRDLLFRHAEARGRDPASIVQTFSIITGRWPRSSDDSTHWLELLRPLVNLGVTHVMLSGQGVSLEPILRFAEEVMVPLQLA